MRQRLPHRPGPALSRGTIGYPKMGRLTRDSQVPGESIPYLCPAQRFRPVRQASPYRPTRCCPRSPDRENTRDAYFGTQSRGFDIRRLRFK
jgi:hypothetical protein